MGYSRRYSKKKFAVRLNLFLAVLILIFSGWGYRVAARGLKVITARPVLLPVPLKEFPVTMGRWLGREVPIPENIQRVAGNDDFLSRLYINDFSDQWANIYIAYSGRPRTMVGHRPEVCYVAGGWIHENTEQGEFLSASGRKVPCLIHRFRKPVPNYAEIIVLNFYILNGRVTRSEGGFSGLGWRTPNIAGDAARYVAQVQISSVLETSVRAAAVRFADMILDFFPDEKGEVGSQISEVRN